MKKSIVLSLIFLACMLPGRYSHAIDDVIGVTVTPFLVALQSGDIVAIKQYVAGEMSVQMTKVFAQDKNYGAFLKQRYDGAVFSPAVIDQKENEIIVRVEITFQGKGKSKFDLLLQKNVAGCWQVVDQYASSNN